MNKTISTVIRSAAALTLVFCLACTKTKQAEQIQEFPLVDVATIKSLQPSLEIMLPGELKPWNKTQMFPRVKGYVASVVVDRGTHVTKGQPMATLEAPELIASLNHARAQVSSAEASLLEITSKRTASQRTYARIRQTSETAGAVSANELEIAYASMISDSAVQRAAEENVLAANAELDAQRYLVAYLTMRAPFDGTIIERNVSPGDLVGPETTGKPLFVLEDGSRLRLTVALPENLANSIDEKSVVSFTTQVEPLKEHKASFARSGNSVLENNRTLIAEFDFANKFSELKPGMYAEVRIPVKRNKATLFVPRSSILHSTEGLFLIKVDNNISRWIGIQKGNTLDSLVEVFGPVREGDRIIKTVHDELRNGQAIRVRSL